MGNISGVVSKIDVFQTSTGKSAYSLHVNGQKFSAGFDVPRCAVGDNVEFATVQNGQYVNMAKNSLRVLAPGSAPVQAQAAPAAASGGNNYADRQDTISRQAASNTALQFLTLLAGQDALDIKKTAKADEKLAAMEALLLHYTAHFYEQNTGVAYKNISPAGEAAVNSAGAVPAEGWQ